MTIIDLIPTILMVATMGIGIGVVKTELINFNKRMDTLFLTLNAHDSRITVLEEAEIRREERIAMKKQYGLE